MKLQINSALRRALKACYARPKALATTLTLGTFTLLSPMAEAAITVGVASGGQFSPVSTTQEDYIIVNAVGGWIGGQTLTWDAPKIYIVNFKQTSSSGNEQFYVDGNLTDGDLLEGQSLTNGNIEFSGTPNAKLNEYIFDGDHRDFSGDFIHSTGLYTPNPATPDVTEAHGRDFNFTNSENRVAEGVNSEAIAGTGAIELGVRSEAVGGLAANASGRYANFFYTGNATIANSHINAEGIRLNGLNAGSASSADAYDSSISAVGTDGASYTISSDLNINNLDLHDSSDASLSGEVVNIQNVNFLNPGSRLSLESSSVYIDNVNMAAANSTIAINSGQDNSIGNIDFGQAGNSINIESGVSFSIDGEVVIYDASQIVNSGSLSYTGSLDVNNVANSEWVRTDENTLSLQVVSNQGDGLMDSFEIGELIWDFSTFGLIGVMPDVNGQIYFESKSVTYSTAGNAEWSDVGIGEMDFANGDVVTIDTNAGDISLDLTTDVAAFEVTVQGSNKLSLSAAGGALYAAEMNLAGDLELIGADVLHADSRVNMAEGSKLTLSSGANVSGNSLISVGGASLNFEVLTGESGIITDQLTGSRMSVTGGGKLTLEGTLLAGNSTTTIAESTTLRVNTGSSSTETKAITGAGTLEFAGNDGTTRLGLANFTGSIALQEGSTGLQVIANQLSGNRYDVSYTGTNAVSLGLYSTGTPGFDTNQHHLNNLSGNINISSASVSSPASYSRDTIVLAMTQDNVWSGTWTANTTQDGGLRVGSAGDGHHSFTITQGLAGEVNHVKWQSLEVRNATVKFAESGTWKGNILFAAADAELRYEGNSQTITHYGTGVSGTASYISGSMNTNADSFTANNYGSIVVATGDVSKIITIDRTNNDYRGSVSVESGTLSIANANAFTNASAMNISGGVLELNNLAVANTITASGGTVSNLGAYAGTLNVTGAVQSTGKITGDIDIAAAGSLTLLGEWDYSQSINNLGTLTFGADMTLSLTEADFAGGSSLTLFEGGGNVNLTDWLTAGGELDMAKITGTLITAGRDFSLDVDTGILSYSTASITHTFAGGLLNLSIGGEITPGANMSDGDSIIFTGDTTLSLDGDISASTITIVAAPEGITVTTLDGGYVLNAGRLVLEEGATLNAGDDITASVIDLANASSLSIASVDSSVVTLDGTAELILSEVQAAGAVQINNITGGADSTLSLALDAAGTDISTANFSGTLKISAGTLNSDLAGLDDYAATVLGENVSFNMSGTLSGGATAVDLSKLQGAATSQLNVALSDGTGASKLTFSDEYKGIVNITAGDLSAFTTKGGVSKFVLNTGTGLIFNASGAGHTFDGNIELAAGVNAEFRSYGTKTETFYRVLSGAVTGDANSTITKTDGGTIQFNNLTGYAGSIRIDSESRIAIQSGASLNTLVLDSGSELKIMTGANVSAQRYEGSSDGGETSLNVDSGATLTITGTGTSGEVGSADPAFGLSHAGGTGTANISGTLVLNSGISNQDGFGVINVAATGKLVLEQGIYGLSKNGNISLNTVSGAALELGNQTQESQLIVASGDDNVRTNIAAGTNLVATDTETNVLNTLNLTGSGNVNLSAKEFVTAVNLKDTVSGTAGLAITGSTAQTFTLSAANSYAGGTTITNTNVSASHFSALGTGNVSLNNGSLNLNNLAVTNDVTVVNGELVGFSAYAGALSLTGNVVVYDTITGNISIADTGHFNIRGTWDFSSAMSNEGKLIFDSSMTLDLTGASFDASNNLTLVTGNGSANIDSWLASNKVDLSSVLRGVETEGRTFSYANGVLSFTTAPVGDIIIPSYWEEPLSTTVAGTITFTDSTGLAHLYDGFAQGPDSSFIGGGEIRLYNGAEVTLSNASTQFSGHVEITPGEEGDITTLTMGHTDALGTALVSVYSFATLAVNDGVALKNDINVAVGGRVETTNIHLSNSSGSQATLRGEDKLVQSTLEGGTISNATLDNMTVQLRAGKSYTLSDITLSGKYDLSVTTSLMRSGVNTSLTINNLSIEASVDDGTLTIPTTTTTIDTTERADQEMYIYGISGIAGLVAGDTSTITGDLTLTLTLTGSEFADFIVRYNTENGLIGFALEGVTSLHMWYHDVDINIENLNNAADNFTLNALGATTNAAGEIVLYIPEPSTATLSLLALAGLLARRRRKTA